MAFLQMLKLLFSLAMQFSVVVFNGGSTRANQYRAAVYEHMPALYPTPSIKPTRQEAVAHMQKNLDIFEVQVTEAKKSGADIIVFPEYGVYGLGRFQRDTIEPFLEDIPDPAEIFWSPCASPSRFNNSEIQYALSCMAMKHALYLVANIGDIKKCDPKLDPHCPTDKRYQFNTNVVYDPKGVLVARYHKYMLFGESYFDVPPKVELITFDTPFGKFGTFTCFDVLFSEPAVALIVKKNVRNIVFPTAWGNELPFLSAIEFHSAFARSMRVNFLSANIHLPVMRFTGSGIYLPNGVATYFYENKSMMGRLLIADVPNLDNENSNTSSISYTPLKITRGKSVQTEQKKFTFIRLHERKSAMKVCNGNLCCYFDYAVASGAHHSYALGAFDGVDVSSTRSRYIQVCTILKCANHSMTSCGQRTKHPSANFSYFHIRGTFEANHVFPEVVSSRDENLILPSHQWTFDKNSLLSKNGVDVPLLSASLYGRIYSRDPDLY